MRAIRGLAGALAMALFAATGAAPLAAGLTAEGTAHVGAVDVFPMGPSLGERLAEIQRRIQEAVVYPPLARRRGLEGLARVGFEIGPRGHASGIELLESTGHSSLDQAARRAVVEAGLLPRVYGRLEVPVRFELAGRR